MNDEVFDKVSKVSIAIIILFTILVVFFALSCGTQKIVEKIVTVHDSIYKERVHDSLITVFKNDSSTLRLKLKCDSMGNVYISRINQLEGQTVKTQFVFKDNLIYVKCEVDSLAVAIKWVNKVTKVNNSNVVTNTVIKEVNKLTQWQIFQMWGGRLLVLMVVLVIGYFVVKNYFKTLL